MYETMTHFSFRPVVLLKNIIIHFSCPICHKHYGLAAHAAVSCLIELQEEKERKTQERKTRLIQKHTETGILSKPL